MIENVLLCIKTFQIIFFFFTFLFYYYSYYYLFYTNTLLVFYIVAFDLIKKRINYLIYVNDFN